MNFLAELRRRFYSALQSLTDDPSEFVAMVKPAQDPRFGDFQANCAMPLANRLGRKPRDVAEEIKKRIDVADLCHPPEIAGPGFINLTLRDDRLQAETNTLVADQRLGIVPTQSPRTYVVDFSSPNVAKPMHVGHLRSTVIGDCLCRLLIALGHKVIGDNHVGDWGTQFGMIIYGYKHFRDEEAYNRDPVGELARLYRLVNELSEYHAAGETLPRLSEQLDQSRAELQSAESRADPNDKSARKALRKLRSDIAELQEQIAALERKREAVEQDAHLKALADTHPQIAVQARKETAKLHAGDEENRELWSQFRPVCMEALQTVYRRLDIHFDEDLGESFYEPMLPEVVAELETNGIARESQGALCVFLEGNEAPFIIRKQDGAYTYATTDLATIKYRVEQFNADAMLYVVDARQSEHFRLLFETARRWGLNAEYHHVSFGTILGPDKRPFRTRAGDTVGLESLLDEAVSRARKIVDANDDAKSSPELDEQTRAEVAEIVGLGGIKYADLRHNRESDYVFSWEKMLAVTGDTATYMQYSYARICGIVRKGGVTVDPAAVIGATAPKQLAEHFGIPEPTVRIQFVKPEERALALHLNRFSEHVESAAREFRPNILTQYLFETANAFSTFYEHCPVLKEEDQLVRTSRLLLCLLTARVLREGLYLLGIRTCERM